NAEQIFVTLQSNNEIYCVETIPWKRLLGFAVRPDTLINFNKEEIMAHCLYEFTWYGHKPGSIDAFNAEMKIRDQEFEEQLKNGTLKGSTAEECLERLRLKNELSKEEQINDEQIND